MSRLEIDKYFYLMGDEDGDVSLQCRVCDTGGLPAVFYTDDTKSNPYKGTDTVIVHLISEMMTAGAKHIARHRAR